MALTSNTRTREKHLTNVIEAARRRKLKWKISSGSLVPERPPCFTRMVIEEASIQAVENTNVPVALTNLMAGQARESHILLLGKPFRIEVAESTHDVSLERRLTLGNLTQTNSISWNADENPLGDLSKLRVTFELSQACLLFLRTPWLQSTCDCKIQCGKLREAPAGFAYEFGLRMQARSTECHIPNRTAYDAIDPWASIAQQWNLCTKSLRRSGLLMIECLVGMVIIEVRCDEEGAVTSINFNQEGITIWKSADEVLERVIVDFSRSDRCKRAFSYSLTTQHQEAPTDRQLREVLADYYDEVVSPYVPINRAGLCRPH